MQPPIYVINLPRSQDRAQRMRQRLGDLGLSFQFIEAIDGKNLSQEERAHYDPTSREKQGVAQLLDAEIACVLSHRKAWRSFLQSNAPFALFLEDDVELHAEMPTLLSKLAFVMELTEFLRLYGLRKRSAMKVAPFLGQWQLAVQFSGPAGAQAYVLSRQGAERLLRHSERFTDPPDIFIDLRWRTGLKSMALLPWPVSEEPVSAANSTISQERRDLQVKARERASWQQSLRRNIAKLTKSLGRTLWAVRLFLWGFLLRSRLGLAERPELRRL